MPVEEEAKPVARERAAARRRRRRGLAIALATLLLGAAAVGGGAFRQARAARAAASLLTSLSRWRYLGSKTALPGVPWAGSAGFSPRGGGVLASGCGNGDVIPWDSASSRDISAAGPDDAALAAKSTGNASFESGGLAVPWNASAPGGQSPSSRTPARRRGKSPGQRGGPVLGQPAVSEKGSREPVAVAPLARSALDRSRCLCLVRV